MLKKVYIYIYIYFKVNVKNNYKKIGKKNDNEVDADLA